MVAQFFCAQGYVWVFRTSTSLSPSLVSLLKVSRHSVLIAASRIIFAYARDGAMPFSSYLCRVNKRTMTPVNAVWFAVVLAMAIGTLMFASTVAIGAVFSILAIGQMVAYSLPIALKVFFGRNRFKPGV